MDTNRGNRGKGGGDLEMLIAKREKMGGKGKVEGGKPGELQLKEKKTSELLFFQTERRWGSGKGKPLYYKYCRMKRGGK